jgi:phage baseplate assembly protein W
VEYILQINPDINEVNFAPNPVEEVLQNVKYILITHIWSVPLRRQFFIDLSFVDQPLPIAKAMYTAEIIEKVHFYEPRAEIVEVISVEREPGDLAKGRLSPTVKVSVNV